MTNYCIRLHWTQETSETKPDPNHYKKTLTPVLTLTLLTLLTLVNPNF